MQKVCSECGELVSEQELNLEFKELFGTIEQGKHPSRTSKSQSTLTRIAQPVQNSF